MGSLRPNCSSRRSIVAWLIRGLAYMFTRPPGAARMRPKLRTLTPNRMKTDWVRRRTRKRPMRLLHVPLLDVMADSQGRRLDAADAAAHRRVSLVRRQEDVRRVLGQRALDLVIDP